MEVARLRKLQNERLWKYKAYHDIKEFLQEIANDDSNEKQATAQKLLEEMRKGGIHR
jgi:hypothetical protein